MRSHSIDTTDSHMDTIDTADTADAVEPLSNLDMPDYKILSLTGLSPLPIICYEALYEMGPDTAGKLAADIKRPRTSVYHALARLEQMGFVQRSKLEIFHQVTRFRAVRLDKALENLAIYQRQGLAKLIEYQIEQSIKIQSTLRAHPQRDWR